MAEEKRQFIDDQRRRNAVEGKIGQGKRRYGLGLISEKLAITQGSTIAINVLVMNLESSWSFFLCFSPAGFSFCLGREWQNVGVLRSQVYILRRLDDQANMASA